MNSYDYLMSNLQSALQAQMPIMKARTRKSKIKDLYERYKNSTKIAKIKNEKNICFGPYRLDKKKS